MKTLAEVKEGLQQAIPDEAIQPADSSAGIFGDYVTAQWAMQEANAIFDVDGIENFEVLADKAVELPVRDQPFGNWVFTTTIRITFAVLDDDKVVHFARIGRGVGTAFAPFDRSTGRFSPVRPQQLDTAAKAALSDAIKNALMRTGQRLGAQLYFNERMAQVLGFEVESDRATRYSESGGGSGADPAPPASAQDEIAELGAVECRYGFGPDHSYRGMTIQEIWDHPDGRNIFFWAVNNEATGWFNERLRRFAELMMDEEDEPEGDGDDDVRPGVRMITIWTGEQKPADERPNWDRLSGNEAFIAMLKDAFDPDDRIDNFSANHRRMVNHYRAHFHVESGNEMTWEMLTALVLRCKEGEDAAAFGYPQYYGQEEETEVPDEVIEDEEECEPSDVESVHNTPPFSIGPARNQNVPAGLQPLLREIGVEDPGGWIWNTLMNHHVVGEWTLGHTSLVYNIVNTIKEGTIDYDTAVIGQMWEFGLTQLAD